MTKTKSCVATRDAVCQATNLFPDEVGTKKCLLPYVSLRLRVQMRYPLNLVLESWEYLWFY